MVVAFCLSVSSTLYSLQTILPTWYFSLILWELLVPDHKKQVGHPEIKSLGVVLFLWDAPLPPPSLIFCSSFFLLIPGGVTSRNFLRRRTAYKWITKPDEKYSRQKNLCDLASTKMIWPGLSRLPQTLVVVISPVVHHEKEFDRTGSSIHKTREAYNKKIRLN